jgi:hypothetical protein
MVLGPAGRSTRRIRRTLPTPGPCRRGPARRESHSRGWSERLGGPRPRAGRHSELQAGRRPACRPRSPPQGRAAGRSSARFSERRRLRRLPRVTAASPLRSRPSRRWPRRGRPGPGSHRWPGPRIGAARACRRRSPRRCRSVPNRRRRCTPRHRRRPRRSPGRPPGSRARRTPPRPSSIPSARRAPGPRWDGYGSVAPAPALGRGVGRPRPIAASVLRAARSVALILPGADGSGQHCY